MPSPGRGLRLGFVEPHLAAFRRDPAHGRVREPPRRARPPRHLLPARRRRDALHVDALRRRGEADAGGFRRRARRRAVQPRAAVAPARPVRARPGAGCSTRCTTARSTTRKAAGRASARRSTSSSPTATGPPTRSSPRPATGPTVQLGGVNREVFHPYPGPEALPAAVQRRAAARRGRAPTRSSRRASCSGSRSSATPGKNLDQPALGPRVRGGTGVRGRELVRGLLPARPRGARVRHAARHDRQRRLPRVRDRRRDRARRPAARRPRDGRRDPPAARRRRARGAARRQRARARGARLRLGAPHRRVRGRARRPVRGPGARRRRPPAGRRRPSPSSPWSCSRGTTSCTRSSSPTRSAATPTCRTSSSIVDNGSAWEAANYARAAADQVVLNDDESRVRTRHEPGAGESPRRATSRSATTTRSCPRDGRSASLQTARCHPERRDRRAGGHQRAQSGERAQPSPATTSRCSRRSARRRPRSST